MEVTFFKYQGTGNDFVIIDNRREIISKNNTKLIKELCDRKFGIGADGLILLEAATVESDDFSMVYFNADGRESSMCGNGGRCIVAFASFLGIIKDKASFSAIDGQHKAIIKNNLVGLKMGDVGEVKKQGNSFFINTGSPHHIVFTENITAVNVKEEGSTIRNSEAYKYNNGTNVNFVEPVGEDIFSVRTFERGVEDETLSCGTGVTAVALAAFVSAKTKNHVVQLKTPGGNLTVSFEEEGQGFKNIWLTGPAKQVFKGTISC